jgi:hypothetical protein
MNSLKSRAMNCGPLSEMIRGLASGYLSLARAESSQCVWGDLRCSKLISRSQFLTLKTTRERHAP